MLGTQLNILVPVTGGTAVSRQGAELAIALAQASQGSVAALRVASDQRRARSWQRHVASALAPMSGAEAIIREIVTGRSLWGRGERCGAQRSNTQEAILRQLDVGGHSLLVMGVSPRPGGQLFFGQVPAELLERAKCSVLFVVSEPPTSAPESQEI
jgi:nucleotide-binding universal stress UspA family protein